MESVKIDRQITLKIRKDELPDDAVFKGYETRVFQDIKPITDNIEFRREIYYSSSLNKTILANLPIMCDDAPQFKKIALYHSLCWVHEGRNFKKLIPLYAAHQDALDKFIEHFWDFYHALLGYQKNPLPEVSLKLSEKYDEIFSTETCYIALNDRITKTLSKKESLLLVLKFPFL